MEHTEKWETCDQCGKVVQGGMEGERFTLEVHSKGFDLDGVKFNLSKSDNWTFSKWSTRIWLDAKGVFCSKLCVVNQFNKIIKEYMQAIDSKVDDLTTDLWGGAGPDCRTMPVEAG